MATKAVVAWYREPGTGLALATLSPAIGWSVWSLVKAVVPAGVESAVWASWVQAIGSILAIAIAGFFVRKQVQWQDQTERKRHLESERNRQIVEVTKALIVLRACQDVVAPIVEMFGPMGKAAKAGRPIATLSGNAVVMPGYVDVTALSFLVEHGALDLIRDLQVLDIDIRNCESSMRARSELVMSPEVRGRLFTHHDATGAKAKPHEYPKVVGEALYLMLETGSAIVAATSQRALNELRTHLPRITNRFRAIYPEATFPEP